MSIIRIRKFNIDKLYLDCIDESGNCFIIYWAKLDLYFFSIFYSGLIFSDPKGFTAEKAVFKKSEKPAINDLLHFSQKSLNIDGSWKRSDDPFTISLYKDSEENEIKWDCHHPKSLAEIIYNEKVYKGYGYAETLSLPTKPWDLPIDELRWGRFLSDLNTIVWINWKGKHPVNRIFLDGIEFNDAVHEDNIISFCGGIYQIMFSEILIIRKGELLNLFSGISWLKVFFNRRILNAMEIKYKAKSTFTKNDVSLSGGWSLFEIVTWAK